MASDLEKYERPSHEEEDEISSEVGLLISPRVKRAVYEPRQSSNLKAALPWILHLFLLSTSASFALYAIRFYSLSIPEDARQYARFKHQQWVNVLGDTPENYQQTRFDGDFVLSTAYKGPPNAEVDAAWQRIIPGGALQVDDALFDTLNASRQSVEAPKVVGGGHLAFFESVHYIHCVYSLWQVSWPEYYSDKRQFGIDNPEAWHFHLDHCADILRQKLMCDADAGLFGYNWIKNHYAPHPNFNVQHQCRNYEAILQYAHDHQADPENKLHGFFLRPTDAPVANFEEPPFDPFAEGDSEIV